MPITTTLRLAQTTFVPTEILYDPTNKLRVAQPESLIDTDFEYGQQTTKWENLATVNNMPFAYPSANAIPNIVSMQFVARFSSSNCNSWFRNSTCKRNSYLCSGFIASPANGNFIIETGGGTTVWTYKARSTNNSSFTAIFDANKTGIYKQLFIATRLLRQ
jgi:hypothetical protein